MCVIITSRTLLPCYLTMVTLTAAQTTGVATVSSLAHFLASENRLYLYRRNVPLLHMSRYITACDSVLPGPPTH